MLMDSLAATPADLARLLRSLDEEAARRRPAPGGWCVADVVAHLGYVEGLYLARLRRIVAEESPSVEYIHPDETAHDLRAPLGELLRAFVDRRAATGAFLAGLAQQDWARPCVHPTMGASRLRDQVQMLVDHDSAHLEQIVALRATLEQS